jgi:fructose-specific phosphotransferase system IIA component
VTDLITEQLIVLDIEANDKLAAIEMIADALLGDGRLLDRAGYIADVLAREALIETGIGGQTAIPHAQSPSVRTPGVAYLRLRAAVEWGESGAVRHVFGIAVPESNADGAHLKILASLARNLLNDRTREVLERSDSKREILDALRVQSEGGE